jgi:CTP:molybdopterin cytidylyltransferase MocA
VLLAAGGSRRLGRPKQLVRYRGRPLLLHAVAAARGALPGAPLIVVVGADALRIRMALRRSGCGARIVMNAQWQAGMATSLCAAVAAATRGTKALVVLVADQPLVDAAAVVRLVTAWRRRPGLPAAARYEGRAGVPAVLPRRHWHALRSLRGDEGARAFLRTSPALTLVDMPEAALDVDTPADVRRLARGSPRANRARPVRRA